MAYSVLPMKIDLFVSEIVFITAGIVIEELTSMLAVILRISKLLFLKKSKMIG